jgi:hypothetical protein
VQITPSPDNSWLAIQLKSGISVCKLYCPPATLASVLAKSKENTISTTQNVELESLGSINLNVTNCFPLFFSSCNLQLEPNKNLFFFFFGFLVVGSSQSVPAERKRKT